MTQDMHLRSILVQCITNVLAYHRVFQKHHAEQLVGVILTTLELAGYTLTRIDNNNNNNPTEENA